MPGPGVMCVTPLSSGHDIEAQVDPEALFTALTGSSALSVERVLGGGNNRIYKVGDDTGGSFALKVYRARTADARPRLRQEFEALQFLGRFSEVPVPQAIVADEDANAAVYSWIDGVRPSDISPADIDSAVAFVALLAAASKETDAQALPDASEACFSRDDLIGQVSGRRTRFDTLLDDEPELARFLEDLFDPALELLLGEPQEASPLEPSQRCLSPSDFGFHNALRGGDDQLTFVDMEYFGWDDPVKLAADFVLHPGMNLDDAHGAQFVHGWHAVFNDGSNALVRRLADHLPLYALRWTMILLNEFLPERWEAKVFAGTTGDWGAVKDRQLAKAKHMVERASPEAAARFVAGALDAVR